MGRGSSGLSASGSSASGSSASGNSVILSSRNNEYFNRVVVQDMERVSQDYANSKNDAERDYYINEIDTKMRRYSQALNVSEGDLKDMLEGKKKIQVEQERQTTPRRATQTNTARTFINSDGEATSRYITSGTYERASKRMTKAMNAWFKGRR